MLKRLALLLLSVALTLLVSTLVITVLALIRQPFRLKDFPVVFIYSMAVLSGFVYRGIIVALPVVLLVSNPRGWRLWVLLTIGTAIGPLTLCIETSIGKSDWPLIFGAAIISGAASLVYLSLLRRSGLKTVSP
jgi:hypothetical protein